MFRFSDGFDSCAATADLSKKWDAVGTNWAWSASGGVNGGGCVQNAGVVGNTLRKKYRTSSGATTVVYASAWVKIAAAPSSDQAFLYFLSDTLAFCGGLMARSSTGLLATAASSATAVQNTSSTNICDNQWHHIEVSLSKPATATLGTLSCWVDGVQVFDGANSGFLANSGITTVALASLGQTITVDDLIVWDDVAGAGPTTSPMGVRTIDTLRPTAAGDDTGFALFGAASNHGAVSEVAANDDTSYVHASVVGTRDLYNFGDLAGTPTTITGVVLNHHVRMEGGTTGQMKSKAKRGTSLSESAAVAVSGPAYRNVQDIFMVDPSTSAPWTKAGVDAAQFGLEIATA